MTARRYLHDQTSFVFLAGVSDPEDQAAPASRGVRLLTKPADVETLRSVVADHLARRRFAIAAE